MRFRTLLALVVAGTLCVGVVAAASRPDRAKGVVSGPDAAGDVTAQGLTAAEAAAIDIVSVRAAGKEGIGVLVTVTFRGNFAALMGRGNLKDAEVAMILRGKAEGSSAGVVTTGPGPLGVVLRHTRATKVGAVRSARSVTFYVIGPGYGDVASVSAEVLVKPPSLGFRLPAGRLQAPPPVHIPDSAWAIMLGATFDDAATVSDPKAFELDKAGIKIVLDMLRALQNGLGREEITYGPDSTLLTVLDDLNGLGTTVRLYSLQLPGTGGVTPVTARLSSEPPGFLLAMANRGPDPIDEILILLRGGAHHTGARLISPAGTCGPGSGPTQVSCIFTKPLPAGASATATVATDRAYDAAQGVDLSSGRRVSRCSAARSGWGYRRRRAPACARTSRSTRGSRTGTWSIRRAGEPEPDPELDDELRRQLGRVRGAGHGRAAR